jgi:protein-disulfide isomerase
MWKKTWAVLGGIFLLLVLLAMAGGAYVVYRQNNAGLDAAAATLPSDRVTAEDMTMGSASAPVTMIEYYAQACSICAAFNKDVFPQIKAKYIDTGKVRYVMRLFPLFPVDGPSYKLTRCVAPDKYFQAVDLLFRNQPEWDNAEYKDADAQGGLMKMARILGLNDDQANQCMNSTARDAAINKTAQDADSRYGIPGTPTFVIDFKKVEIATPPRSEQSWRDAQAAIDAALAAKGAK